MYSFWLKAKQADKTIPNLTFFSFQEAFFFFFWINIIIRLPQNILFRHTNIVDVFEFVKKKEKKRLFHFLFLKLVVFWFFLWLQDVEHQRTWCSFGIDFRQTFQLMKNLKLPCLPGESRSSPFFLLLFYPVEFQIGLRATHHRLSSEKNGIVWKRIEIFRYLWLMNWF